MADITESFQGVLQGQSIKLDRPPNLPDGSKVNVTVRKAKLSASERQDKLKELFGGCADDALELDRYMERRLARSNGITS